MFAGPLPSRVRHVIAERQAVLWVVLNALAAADNADKGATDGVVEVGPLDDIGIRRARGAAIVLEANGRLVKPVAGRVAMFSDHRVHVGSDVVSGRIARNA